MKTKSEFINPKVLKCLKRSDITQVNKLWHLTTADRLSVEEYKQLQLIVHGLRGEWVRNADAHVFQFDPTSEINAVMESGCIPSFMFNQHSFFPTPMGEIKDAIELSYLDDSDGVTVLEPSAGDGRFIRAILEKCPKAIVDYYEIDEKNQQICKTSISKNTNFKGSDFLSDPQTREYDFIFMNPPFNGKEYQKHVRKAASWLKGCGVLVSIMPKTAWLDRKFRDWMFGEMNGTAYEMAEAFEDTKTNTIMVVMYRPERFPLPPLGYPSYYMFINEITLDSDAKFIDRVQSKKSIDSVARLVQDTVNRFNKEGVSMACTESDALYLATQYRPDLVA